MKRRIQEMKITLSRETVRMLDPLHLVTAGGIFTAPCAPTVTCTDGHKTCDTCSPC